MPRVIQNYLQARRHKRLASRFDLHENTKVLDISCGDGDLLAILNAHKPNMEWHGVDASKEAVEQAKEHYPWAHFSVACAEALPYPDHTFSAVLSCMSLHHYQYAPAVFKEVARVLLDDSEFYIADLVPN